MQPVGDFEDRPGVFDRLGRNLAIGFGGGIAFACLYSAYVLFLALGRGPTEFESANAVSLPLLVAAYFAAGITVGLIVGLLLPLTRWWWGAMIVGSVGGIPFTAAMKMVDTGSIPTVETFATVETIFLALVIGSMFGLAGWKVFYHDAQ